MEGDLNCYFFIIFFFIIIFSFADNPMGTLDNIDDIKSANSSEIVYRWNCNEIYHLLPHCFRKRQPLGPSAD